MKSVDHYGTLGILPDAEEVVITAAYRALAQRYHPDRWSGDEGEAHRRMTAINAAYEVLSDKRLRAEYDKSRLAQEQDPFASEEATAQSEAFSAALDELEGRWSLACSIYPDLVALRGELSTISTALAFEFVTSLLASKAFERRRELAEQLEKRFLRRYFGTDELILNYAKSLIVSGHKAAAKSLNRLVDVLGSETDASLLVKKIEQDFGLNTEVRRGAKQAHLQALAKTVRYMGLYKEAKELAGLLGHRTTESGGGLFSSPSVILVVGPNGKSERFEGQVEFVRWVQQYLCPTLL